MQTIPEQISSATRAPIEAQLELFGSIAIAAVENTGRLAQFQIDASRAAMDQAFGAWRQLLTSGPQQLFDLMSRASGQLAMTPPAPAQAAQPQDDASSEAQPQVAEPYAPMPAAHRTPIAEAASQVVADGQAGLTLAAAPAPEPGEVDLPRVKPVEAVPPAPFLSHGVTHRKGIPRK